MAAENKPQSNLFWSQVIGCGLGCVFLTVYMILGNCVRTLLILFCLQALYILISILINKKFGQIFKSNLAFIPWLIYIVPAVNAYFQFSLPMAILLWCSILPVLILYGKYLNEPQTILLFFFYHIFTFSDELVYAILGYLFFIGILILRLTKFNFVKKEKKEST